MSGLIEHVKEHLCGLFNIPYVPEEILGSPRPRVLHISDTPSNVYPFIFRLIQILKPEYLIHTGDFIDEIKLENRPGQITEYRPKLKTYLTQLESLPVGTIYLVPGNHDHVETVVEYARRSTVLTEYSRLKIHNNYFFVSHYYQEAEVDADFFLFGHSLTPDHSRKDSTILLNGIPAIHIISLPTKQVYSLRYPSGTDSARKLLLPKIGL